MPRDDNTDGYTFFLNNTARLRDWFRGMNAQQFQNIVLVATLIVTTVYVALTYGLFRRATRAAEIANRQLELTDRPWIRVNLALASPTRLVNGSVAFFPRWTLSNVGRSVASDVYNEWTWYVQAFSDRSFTEPLERQKEACARTERPDRRGHGQFLFPDEVKASTGSFTVDPAGLREAQAKSPEGIASEIVVTGCVAYRYSTSTGPHHTGYIYLLRHDIQPGQAVWLTPEWLFDSPLDPEAVTIDTFFFGSPPVD